MALFDWNPTYSVGVDQLDRQHKQLFELLNSLHDSVRNGQSRVALRDAFQRMREYTNLHFVEEEEAMRSIHYPAPAFMAHCQEHESLRIALQDHHQAYTDGRAKIGIDTLNFLLRWWTDHILRTDRQYKNYFLP